MVSIVAYDPTWPDKFRSIGGTLDLVLGDLALSIDHIGSTAVPGLAAKDKIDIQVTVAKADAFPGVEKALLARGFKMSAYQCDHVPPGAPESAEQWEKRLFMTPEGEQAANIHVRISGRANQRYPLLFRDYLRANHNAAKAYQALKEQLAKYHSDDIEAYCDIKDPACDLISCAAEAWAKETKWNVLA